MKRRTNAAVLCLSAACFASSVLAQTPLERGRYLMQAVAACGNCHTPQDRNGPKPGMELAGGLPFDEPGFKAYASNITPDPETGIGRWTDAQIVIAIREGKRPDGSLIGPPMPFEQYRGISDRDVAAIVAHLRSVPPVKNAVRKSDYFEDQAAAGLGPAGAHGGRGAARRPGGLRALHRRSAGALHRMPFVAGAGRHARRRRPAGRRRHEVPGSVGR